jgi:DNA-binding CsgD family transcriptional regulator
MGDGMHSVTSLAPAQPYHDSLSAHPRDLVRCESPPLDPLADLWERLIGGRLQPTSEGKVGDTIRFLARITHGPALRPDDASLLMSVLCGEARKALACDLGIAVSTTTGRYLRALAMLHLSDCTTPLTVVLAAQSRSGLVRIPDARSKLVHHDGHHCLSVSIPRPLLACAAALTPVQQQVAEWLIEGSSRDTIAERRATSPNTVAGQVHAIFRALRVTGRYALIRRACDLGCLGQLVKNVA